MINRKFHPDQVLVSLHCLLIKLRDTFSLPDLEMERSRYLINANDPKLPWSNVGAATSSGLQIFIFNVAVCANLLVVAEMARSNSGISE